MIWRMHSTNQYDQAVFTRYVVEHIKCVNVIHTLEDSSWEDWLPSDRVFLKVQIIIAHYYVCRRITHIRASQIYDR